MAIKLLFVYFIVFSFIVILLISRNAVCRPYHTLLLLEDEHSLLSSLPIDASPSLIRLVKVANPLKNLHSLSLDADLAVEQVITLYYISFLYDL